MAKISVVICCANAADALEATCVSCKWADEVIVVDSGSTDATPTIAQKFATRYVVEPWRGYAGQKKFATELCKNDWVFFVDGDEECSPELAKELTAISDAELERYDLLLIPRRNWVMGRVARAWWPDYLTRLFHRTRCTWSDEVLHDTRIPSHPSRVKKATGWLEHKRISNAGFTDYFGGRRLDDRLVMVAQQMHARGKRCRWYDLVFRPRIAFVKSFIFKRGFLDGTWGLLVAQKSAVSTQLKYAALWAVQNGCATPPDREN